MQFFKQRNKFNSLKLFIWLKERSGLRHQAGKTKSKKLDLVMNLNLEMGRSTHFPVKVVKAGSSAAEWKSLFMAVCELKHMWSIFAVCVLKGSSKDAAVFIPFYLLFCRLLFQSEKPLWILCLCAYVQATDIQNLCCEFLKLNSLRSLNCKTDCHTFSCFKHLHFTIHFR